MTSHYVFILVAVYWFISDIPVIFTIVPFCLTWNTTSKYLTIDCTVLVATYDIFIIDPFGNNRVQCILGHSPGCSESHKHDQLFEEISENLTTLTLKTDRSNAEGEWKCRHGNEETKSQVTFKEGIGPPIDIEISGEVRKMKQRNKFTLECFSCWKPYITGVDIFVNNVLEDSIRYHEGVCYHRENVCSPDKCACLAKGTHFTWNFISDLSYIHFTCAISFWHEMDSTIVSHNAGLMYNGSVFIQTQKTRKSITNTENSDNHYIDSNKDVSNYSELIGYLVLGTVSLIILGIIILCFWRIHGMKNKQAWQNKSGQSRKSETIPLEEFIAEGESGVTKDNNQKACTRSMVNSSKKCNTEFIAEGDSGVTKDKNPKGRTHYMVNSPSSYDLQYITETSNVEDINLFFLCSNHKMEIEYTHNLILNLQTFGFKSQNIRIIVDTFPDVTFPETLAQVLKLIIVIPSAFELQNNKFLMLVEKAVQIFKENTMADILPIIRSRKVLLPLCLSDVKLYSSLGPELYHAVLRCPETQIMDGFLPSLRTICNIISVQNKLNEIVISQNAIAPLEQFGFAILKGWGVEVEEERVSFHMNTLQKLSHYDPICLQDIFTCLLRDKSFRFLRLYDIKPLDVSGLKLHTHMYSQLIKIFKLIIDRKSEMWWYHYRRNGFRHKGSSEGAFKSLKQAFLDKKSSVIFHQFSTYQSRLGTFHNYPIKNQIYREQLAFAGFFHFNVSDYVQCFHCGGCLRAWQSMHDPMERHRLNFKTCPFAKQSEMCESLKGDIKSVKFARVDRLNSFKSFPIQVSEDDLKRLTMDGFYYCGIAADIVCCKCNIGFSNVQTSYEILRLHQTLSPNCENIPKCENHDNRNDSFDPENISNFVPYLELEYRKHIF